jgi:hypothetical protein
MFVNGSEQIVQSLERTFNRCFLPSFSSFGWGVSEENIKMSSSRTTDDRHHGRKHLLNVLSKDCTICSDPLTNMAATGNSCFWLADLNKSSPLKLLGQMNRNLAWSIYGRSKDEMSILQRGHSIDASYQVSVHLVKRFQRRRIKCEKLKIVKRKITLALRN